MGSDMVVALSRATVDGQTFFGHNSNRSASESQSVLRRMGRTHEEGETLSLQYLTLPQVRRTLTVVASCSRNQTGYHNGVNERGLAVARTPLRARLDGDQPGLTGSELVRLLLERAPSARDALDLAADLIGRCGQARSDEGPDQDSAFLIADATEAYVLVVCGSYWLVQEVADWQALNEGCQLPKGWQRGWRTKDGGKPDFEPMLGMSSQGNRAQAGATGLLRHRRAVHLLEQQNGHLDLGFLRRLLSDHFEGGDHEIDPWSAPGTAQGLCQHPCRNGSGTAVSLVARLDPAHEGSGDSASVFPPPVRTVWYAFGPPCTSVYFPIFFEGDVPAAFQSENGPELSVCEHVRLLTQRAGHDRGQWLTLREALANLQGRFDQETREFHNDVVELIREDNRGDVGRLAGAFMQHNLERFEDLCRSLLSDARQPTRRALSAREQERMSQMTEL